MEVEKARLAGLIRLIVVVVEVHVGLFLYETGHMKIKVW